MTGPQQSRSSRIGYYVHHQGSGHVQHACAIAAHTANPVVAFSSRRQPPGWPGDWVELPSDAGGVDDPLGPDVTANGTLHWAPRLHDGLRHRMELIGRAIVDSGVDLMVVDVSVEVAVLARLYGVPVAIMAMPGERFDRPHRLAYDLAELLIAPWPAAASQTWPRSWLDKTLHVGALSRFDECAAPDRSPGRRVLVLWGSGGLDVSANEVRAAAAATPDWNWHVAGPGRDDGRELPNLQWHGWIEDVWSELCAADVVVTHAGQNAIAETAAARRPALVIPQQRPFREQHATAETLRRADLAVVVDQWPSPADWPGMLRRAAGHDGAHWANWSGGNGASRVAKAFDDILAAAIRN